MKKRKTKSRMTRVDLDAVLKLQKDYCDQTYEIQRTLEAVVALGRGDKEPLTLLFGNDLLSAILAEARDMATRIKELEQQLAQKKI